MQQLVIIVLLFSFTSCYHILPEQEIQQHSTKLDFLKTTNKTISDFLSGKLNPKCVACEAFVETLQILMQLNASKADFSYVITKACNLFKVEDNRVCSYITEEFQDEFMTVAARLVFHPQWLCFVVLGPSCGEPPDLFDLWNVTIPGNKPKPETLVRPEEGLQKLRVVQLSDMHIDLAYKPGSVKNCGEPLCCREGKSSDSNDQAGFWGSLDAKCDIPLYTFENALQYVAEEIKPDLIFWTGDIPAHNVWDQSRDQQIHHIQITADLLSKYFPDVQVFPSLGNHESSPVDSFPPPGMTNKHLSNYWLNSFVQKVWSRWLPLESLPTIEYAGYYAVQYSKELRVISLNTQYCDNYNFWLYLNNTDPGGQLQWLVEELAWAEAHNNKVIILGHIPPCQQGCLKSFSWNYYRIIDRFESTIVGQYMGHTHQDQYCMMYSEDGSHHPTGFQFISPSLTTYTNLRPSIRLYTLDGVYPGSTFRPLQAETFLLDLDRANDKNETVWEKQYDTYSAYNLTWLVPETMHSLYKHLESDRGFFDKTFFKYKFHSAPNETCDEDCYKSNLCEIITGRSHDPDICRDVSLDQQKEFHAKHKMC